jgi:hypothetical protein
MSSGGYTGPIPRYGGYYIHYHQENIGKAGGHGIVPDITAIFQNQKKSALEATKSAYKTMFRNNISDLSLELLGEVLSDEDEPMTELNRQMSSKLQDSINEDSISRMVAIQRRITSKKSFGEAFLKGGKEKIEALSNLLEALAECCTMLYSEEGGYLGAALMEVYDAINTTPNITNRNIGIKLQKVVKEFATENNGATFEQQQVNLVVNKINNLANALISKTTASSGQSLTVRSINALVDHIFSDAFAESFAAMLTESSWLSVADTVMAMTGGEQYQAIVYDDAGRPIVTASSATGKTDIKAKNVTFTIDGYNDISGGEITLDLGLSNKTYKTNHVKGLDNKIKSQTYEVGAGGTLQEAFQLLFGGNIYNKYLAYNIIAHRSQRPIEAEALQDIILTRQLLRLFSSRGGSQDFSQFMILNGEVVSIWSLILAAQNFVGKSRSVNTDQPISLSIPSGPAIEKMAENQSPMVRIYTTNRAINSATITASVHLDKLMAAAGNK